MSFQINGSVVVDNNRNGQFTTVTVRNVATESNLPSSNVGSIIFVASYSGGGPRHVYVQQDGNWV